MFFLATAPAGHRPVAQPFSHIFIRRVWLAFRSVFGETMTYAGIGLTARCPGAGSGQASFIKPPGVICFMNSMFVAVFPMKLHLLNGPLVRWSVTAVYLVILALISIYGVHRYWLVYLFYKRRGGRAEPDGRYDRHALPPVTVQLPMYNEAQVAQRVIDAACGLDYPRHLLQIQVLDDSTDGSAANACGVGRRAAWTSNTFTATTARATKPAPSPRPCPAPRGN